MVCAGCAALAGLAGLGERPGVWPEAGALRLVLSASGRLPIDEADGVRVSTVRLGAGRVLGRSGLEDDDLRCVGTLRVVVVGAEVSRGRCGWVGVGLPAGCLLAALPGRG